MKNCAFVIETGFFKLVFSQRQAGPYSCYLFYFSRNVCFFSKAISLTCQNIPIIQFGLFQ